MQQPSIQQLTHLFWTVMRENGFDFMEPSTNSEYVSWPKMVFTHCELAWKLQWIKAIGH